MREFAIKPLLERYFYLIIKNFPNFYKWQRFLRFDSDFDNFFDLPTAAKIEYDDFVTNFDKYRKWFADKIATYLPEVAPEELEFLQGLRFHKSIFLQALLYTQKPLVYNKETDPKFRFSTNLAKMLNKEQSKFEFLTNASNVYTDLKTLLSSIYQPSEFSYVIKALVATLDSFLIGKVSVEQFSDNLAKLVLGKHISFTAVDNYFGDNFSTDNFINFLNRYYFPADKHCDNFSQVLKQMPIGDLSALVATPWYWQIIKMSKWKPFYELLTISKENKYITWSQILTLLYNRQDLTPTQIGQISYFIRRQIGYDNDFVKLKHWHPNLKIALLKYLFDYLPSAPWWDRFIIKLHYWQFKRLTKNKK